LTSVAAGLPASVAHLRACTDNMTMNFILRRRLRIP